jgi:hypothetical protein
MKVCVAQTASETGRASRNVSSTTITTPTTSFIVAVAKVRRREDEEN